ncbi:MAG: penicillin-binding protein 1C [Chthoniobacteraceae bacterium]
MAGWLGLKLVPIPVALEQPAPGSTEFVDRDGRTLRETRTGGHFARCVALDDMPQRLVHAMLAAEDKRFFDHAGVDFLAVLRAARDGIAHRRIVSGASTITQQLVKVAEPRPRTWRTKIVESVIALRLDQLWSKERILEAYFNRVDFGHLNVGIAAAADYYFGKPLNDLTDAECAFLAGLPKNPSRLNPHRSMAAAQSRQRTVLRRMERNGWLAGEAFARAMSEPPGVRPPKRQFRAPHFVDLVLREADVAAPRIRTTLDLELNDFAQARLAEQLAGLKKANVTNGAVVVIDNATSSVLALVGSGDYFAPAAGQVNGAWAPRSAGSTVKPFTYLLALERGATPATIYADVPTEFAAPDGIFRVENYARRCNGPVSLRSALSCSLNIPAVRALNSIGGPAALARRLRDCGFSTLTRTPAEYGLGLTIGNAEVRLLDLANAYACLARLGEFRPWRIFADEPLAPARQAADPRACWLIADILSDNAARIPSFGATSALRFDFPVACKTGTSTDYRDNWAVGYTPEFTVAVWAGNFDGTPMRGVSGVSGAAPVMHAVMEHLHARSGTSWFATPPNIIDADVHPLTGRRIEKGWPTGVRERFLAEHLPPAESPEDYDEDGRVRLPAVYAEWLASAENPLGAQVVAAEQLRIVSPAPGTTFIIDPDLPGSRRVRLVASGSPSAHWQSETLGVSASGREVEATLAEGEHRLSVIDQATGARVETWIRVKSL